MVNQAAASFMAFLSTLLFPSDLSLSPLPLLCMTTLSFWSAECNRPLWFVKLSASIDILQVDLVTAKTIISDQGEPRNSIFPLVRGKFVYLSISAHAAYLYAPSIPIRIFSSFSHLSHLWTSFCRRVVLASLSCERQPERAHFQEKFLVPATRPPSLSLHYLSSASRRSLSGPLNAAALSRS